MIVYRHFKGKIEAIEREIAVLERRKEYIVSEPVVDHKDEEAFDLVCSQLESKERELITLFEELFDIFEHLSRGSYPYHFR